METKIQIKNKIVFLRADFNVPIENGVVKDDYRIVSTLKTLEMLKSNGCRTIIVSHIETKDIEKPTLKPVFIYLKEKYPELDISFFEDIADPENFEELSGEFSNIKEGGFLLLENIRNLSGEKTNDIELAKKFKDLTEVYVNDAFAVSHRDHMSVSALPSLYDKEHKMFGLQMQIEIDSLTKILNPEKPFSVILSGAKFSTKLPLIEKYLKVADNLFIGGALLNNVLKSLGNNVGVSLVDNEASYIDTMVKENDFLNKVFIPSIVVVKNVDTNEIRNSSINDVKEKETIQDISDQSIYDFVKVLEDMKVKTIVWNGPLGNYEDENFKTGTITLAKSLISYIENNTNAHLFIGGGDTVAAVNELHIQNPRVFVSTGGGAMLEFLEKDGKLPGVVNVLE
jgi:phosphoglycerate kinase